MSEPLQKDKQPLALKPADNEELPISQMDTHRQQGSRSAGVPGENSRRQEEPTVCF